MEDRVRIAGIQPSRMRGMTAMYHRRFFLDVNLTTVLILVLFVVFVAIVVAMTTGDFSGEGSWILDNPWGRMSLIDIYVGIALFAGWVFPREGSPWVAILWLPAFVILGNAGTALYAAIAAFRTDDIRTFLLGARA
jgi:hypothetical protein